MDFRSVLDGSQRGLLASLLRFGLWFASVPYWIVVSFRNALYQSGRLSVFRSAAQVISIGNLTAGGTGKTPMVAAVAKHLREKHFRVALLSRGYRSDESGSNDEARELFDLLPDVPHLQNPDRIASAKIAVDELDMEILILDDGFQHRRLARDLDIVLIDATCPWGGGFLLPAGLLREPARSLKRAHAVLITRAGRVSNSEIQSIVDRIHRLAPAAVIAQCDHVPRCLRTNDGSVFPLQDLAGKRVIAFAGIGNPKPFFQSIAELGAQVIGTQILPDHCPYDRETMMRLTSWIQELMFASNSMPTESEILVVCTHKDLVKIRTARIGDARLLALQIELEITDNAEAFWAMVDRSATPMPFIDS